MSLQAWYVFNNNFQNYGVGDADLTQSVAPTFSANGKVSQYSFQSGQLKWTAEQTAKILNNTAVSIAFWIYPNLDTGTTYSGGIFGNDTMSSLGGRQYSVYQYPTCNDLHLSWQNYNNSSYSSALATVVTGVLPSKQWTHVCITYQNPRVIVYINGIPNTTFNANMNTSSYSYATDVIKGSESKRFINDLRIYDHCLSAKEVKEISKGLILHMPLDNNGAGMPNLAKNPSTYSRKSSNVTFSNNQITIAAQPNQDTYFDIALSEALIENKEYILSWYVEGLNSSDTAWGFPLFAQTNPLSKVIYVKNGYNSITFICNSTYAGQTVIFMDDLSGRPTTNSTPIIISKIKLEYGNKVTSWCPNSTDALYSSLGFNTATVYDTSGYCHNGTKTGEVSADINSPRYNTASKFISSSYISVPIPTIPNFNVYTFSWWGKISEYSSNKMFWGFSNGNRLNLYGTGGIYCWNTGDSANNPFGSTSVTGQADNNWHHFAVTSDGTIVKLYIDGIFKANAKTFRPITGTIIYLNGWDTGATYKFNGSLSDYRLYTTCLSADDIAELYKVPISIDNTGKVHAIEFNEV